jgi:hypothetical protein
MVVLSICKIEQLVVVSSVFYEQVVLGAGLLVSSGACGV